MSEIVIGIAKRWPNSRVPWWKRGSRGGQPKLMLYYYDENGKFRTKSINQVQGLLKKSRVLKRRVFYCLVCGSKIIGLTKNGNDCLSLCPNGCGYDTY